jgi:hypothetical protein
MGLLGYPFVLQGNVGEPFMCLDSIECPKKDVLGYNTAIGFAGTVAVRKHCC